QDLAARDGEFKAVAELEKAKQEAASVRLRAVPAAAPPAPGAGMMPGGGGFGGRGGGLLREAAKADRAMDLSQGGQSLAQAGDVGEMFRYQIASPVKLERSKSAMLPIVNESVSGDKVSIYNEGTHAKHPLNGLRLK